ncbi:outer membrane beta-barrel protein [Novosphingobium flavum]|uniref:Outer membrane beta-barrel protein n=1 Tax=Novosphingobium flavum TaxID=1778672 RepID=A0A7X1FQQ6_9SPHN|nr:outer membrane beta-barrel protein [Novosphingobium flavum]MBC2665225.1 outer membrane beta-barrel protein [Novosphingobium flavum]
MRRNPAARAIAAALELLVLVLFAACAGRRPRWEARKVILLGHLGRKIRRPAWLCRLAIFFVAISGPRAAFAQEAAVTTPIQMFEPETGAGLRLGPGLVLHAEAAGGAAHDTNIYNLEQKQTPDTVFSLRPAVSLATDLPRHRIELRGSGELRRFAHYTGENSETWDLSLSGLAELGGWIDVKPSIGIARGIELRGSAGDQFLTDHPVAYTRKTYALSVARGQHRLRFAANGAIEEVNYHPTSLGGVAVDLSARNFVRKAGSIRSDLDLGGRFSVFAELAGNRLSYDVPAQAGPGVGGRNSSGFAVLAGARFRVTSLVDVEAGAGYLRQGFSGGPFRPVEALNYRLAGTWTPRPRWQVKAGVERSIDASPRLDTPALFRTTYRLSALYAQSSRLLLGAGAVYQREVYQAIDRTDRRFDANVTAQYRLAPGVGITAAGGYRHQTGGQTGRSYHGVIASLSLRVIA